MSEFNIEVEGGSSVRLPTGGKYCPKDIIVTAKGGSSAGGGASDIDALIDGTITEVNSGASSVVDYAFYTRTKLTTATFPNATKIGHKAFKDCSIIRVVNFPKVTEIGQYAFSKCFKLGDINFPNVTKIDSNAFEYCHALITAEFPSVTNIVDSAFSQAQGLTGIVAPKTTQLGYSPFGGCIKLETVDFPELTKVGSYTFSGCSVLVSANLGKLTNATAGMFNSCYSLKSVILHSETVCSLANTNAFQNCYHILGTVNATYNPNGDKDCYIYVPANLVEAYKSASNWSTYASQIRAIAGSESNKLPTPEITGDDMATDAFYVSGVASATTVDVYYTEDEDYTAEGASWNLLYTQECVIEGDDGPVRVIGDSFWLDTAAIVDQFGVTARPLWLCVVAHAPDYEDSDPSNVYMLEN